MRYKLLYYQEGKKLDEMDICAESDEIKTLGYVVANRADRKFIVRDTYKKTIKFV